MSKTPHCLIRVLFSANGLSRNHYVKFANKQRNTSVVPLPVGVHLRGTTHGVERNVHEGRSDMRSPGAGDEVSRVPFRGSNNGVRPIHRGAGRRKNSQPAIQKSALEAYDGRGGTRTHDLTHVNRAAMPTNHRPHNQALRATLHPGHKRNRAPYGRLPMCCLYHCFPRRVGATLRDTRRISGY